MEIRCHTPFGNFKPGDEIEVPDGAAFDSAYFELAEAEAEVETEDKEGTEE